MSNNTCVLMSLAYFITSFCILFPQSTTAAFHGGGSVPVPAAKHGSVVTVDQRRVVVSTEFGEISTVKVSDGKDGFYDLQFITLEPNSLFVPVHLHSDMVFYVNSGSGTLSWVDPEKDKGKLRQLDLRTGDVYRLPIGSFFYLQSNLDSDRRKFRINAIFSDSRETRDGSSFGAYSSVVDLLFGFDDKILQAALNVDEAVIQELRSGGQQQMIVHGVSKVTKLFELHYRNMRAFLGLIDDNDMIGANKDKKGKAYNILEAKPDFKNCNGWSLIVTSMQMDALRDSDFGIFMVNLTKGAMMGPHWNPLTAEIAVVLSGRGMVHVVCPSSLDEAECKNSRFRVEEGDVFVVPRYHPMAQISFNNGSFVFMGFTTTQKNNHPQYLVGSASVFQVLNKRVLAASLGVSNTTMDELLSAQNDAVILECTSCAEEEERLMEEEIERQKEEEAREREEEERKREEEEEARRQEEEARREEEEEVRREEEEARKREEEAARREEEEARKREEEQEAKRRQEEEEAARKQEEEAARQREEEEAAATERRREEEEAAQKQEEEAERRQQEEEEAAKKREQEEADRRQEQKEEAARQHEEADRRQEQKEEAARQQEEAMRRQQEEEAARQQEAARRRQQEEAARQQEEAMRRQQEEEAARQQEAARRRHQEEEAARRQEAAMRHKQEEEAARQQEEAMRHQQEEEAARQHKAASGRSGPKGQGEGEAARKGEEEMAHRAREADEAAGRRREPRGQGGGIKTEIENPQRM